MKIWDISRTLSNDFAEWPGDEAFRYRVTMEIAKGASVNLGAIAMSVSTIVVALNAQLLRRVDLRPAGV